MDWRVRSIAQLLLLGFFITVIECGTPEQRVVCYYTNWSVYRPGTAKFSPQNINPYLCTHLIYAFGGFTKENTLKPFDKYQDIEKGGYAKFTGLKTYNKNLKTMLAVGGWNEGSTRFSPMVADPERRKQFVRNTVKFLRQNHFDGLDLDWEYPAFRDGGKPRDRDNYASLVQELREAYEREASKTGRPRLLLSMAVPAGIEYINKGYDIPKLNKYLDFINLLSYDYHSSYEPAVNHHSPLYPLEEDNEYNFDTELTVDYTIKHLLESGASADKIVLGIPTYGRSYTLFNEEATDIGSPSDGPGEEGDATREKGYLAYYEICEALMDSEDWEVVSPNSNAMGPYAYKGNQWVGYDDEAIVRLKAQYVTENGLGGIMFWSIDNDDFRGKCHNRPYPLIEAAKEAMLAGSEKDSVREKTTRPTKTRTESNFIGRKLGTGRRRTTEAPVANRQEGSSKRVNSLRTRNQSKNRDNLDEEETQVPVNGRTRGQFNDAEEDDEDSNTSRIGSNVVRSIEYAEDQEKETSRPQSGNRARNGQGRRKKPESNRRRSTTEASVPEPSAAQGGNRITTPEPPTTPDPGTDFKCEDEGFFSHPRDCKKYFWCLDAGPGGLGIVAHHFTCPAGLVFNKAADSCDYPRNVVCPKIKPAEAPTTRAPIIAATSRTTRIQSTTRRSASKTTTESNEYSEEYEYYDDEDEEVNVPVTTTTVRNLQYKTISRNRPTTSTTTAAPSTTTQIARTSTSRSYQAIPSRTSTIDAITSIEESEEDPKVIQELIELIKKAGGIEELEKQLHLQGKGSESSGQSSSVTNKADATPATISRSLYERVLNRQATNGGNTLFRRTTVAPTTVAIEVTERLDTQASVPQRSKPSFRNGPGQAQFEGLDDIPEVKSLRRERPQYVTINRQRPSTESPDETSEEIVSDNTNGASSDETLLTSPPEPTPNAQKETHGYVEIRRSRTSTARSNILDAEDEGDVLQQRRRPATSETETEDEDDDDDKSKDSQTNTETVVSRRRHQFPAQEKTSGTTSRYTTIQRVRSTTQSTDATSAEDDEEIIESNKQPSNSPTDIITTTISSEKVDDKVSVPETVATNEAAIGQPILDNTTPVIESISSTETPNLAPTDLPLQNIEPSTTLLPITEKVVEEFSTTATSIIVPSSSTEESNSDELATKGSTTVPQSRPHGFQRRTRPTTTTTSVETTASSVSSDSGRVKVPSETVRLPTLKELIGHNTIVAHDYTTTSPITLSIENLLNDNALNPNELYTKYISETVTPTFEKELLLEEVGNKKATGMKQDVYIINEDQSNRLETAQNNDYTNAVEESNSSSATESSLPVTLPIRVLKQDKMPSRRRRIKFVNIPVRILESDTPLKDVILEVPEYKLNRVLKSLLRVEILNKDNETNSNSEKSKDGNNYGQRIRYNQNLSEDNPGEVNESNELWSTDANINSIVSENRFTSTTPSISTVRGTRLFTTPKSQTRGFYVTKSIESNTLYENITPPTTTKVTDFDNELTQQFGTTTDQLSTSDDDSATLATSSVASTDKFYTGQEESTSQQFSTTTEQLTTLHENLSTITEDSLSTISGYYTRKEESISGRAWPSMISTSLENFNDILANNADIESAELVTQKTTVEADITSTEYLLSTTEKLNDIESTTKSAFTESDEKLYTSDATETIEPYSTKEPSSTISEEIFEHDADSDISTTTSSSKIETITEDLDYYTAINTAEPDLQETTINQITDSTTESTTSAVEATRLTTDFDSYTEASTKPNFEKPTVPAFEGTSDSTEFLSTESSTSNFENTATFIQNTGFSTEVYTSTETSSIHSTSDFTTETITTESNSDFKSTTPITDEPLDNDSVSQTAITDSTTINSVSDPDLQPTTITNINSETSTVDLTTTAISISTDSTLSDISTTTGDSYSTIAVETETDSLTTNDIPITNTEMKTTTEISNIESTTDLDSTGTSPTPVEGEPATEQPQLNADSIQSTKINDLVDAQTVSTLVTSGSETTLSPLSDADDVTTGSTVAKHEEPVNETLEIPRQSRRPFLPTQATGSILSSRGFYRSPTAIPGRKNVRRRIIKKRIYGVRRPLIEPIPVNESAIDIKTLNTDQKFNASKIPKQGFIRRRIINHTTGKIVDEVLRRNSTGLLNRIRTNNLNPGFVQKTNNSLEFKNALAEKLLSHRATFRRQPANNQTNSNSIEANISSQNNSASNDVQSSSVSSTNPNQRRRIVVKRFRYRGSGLVKSSTVSPNPSPISRSLLVAEEVSQLNLTESTIADKLQEDKRETSRQDYNTDVTIDNSSSGSEIYDSVTVYGKEELPRTESISEALQSEDEQTNGEINLFKTRVSNSRRPGTLIRPTRPSTSTSIPENEIIVTTVSPSTKLPNNIAVRRRFRLGQRPSTPSTNAGAQSQALPGDGETLKSGTDENILESLDQTGHAQEVEATVADENPSTPISRVSTGRPPFRTSIRRRIITTEAPQLTVSSTHQTIVRQRQRPKPFEKISENQPARPRHPAIIDYDYYEDTEERIVGKPKLSGKIAFTSGGSIRCLDQGNFPHPSSCKKFITCARMVSGQLIGTEYTCPKRLSFDPIGGICNWSAGLGCKE